MPWSSCDIEAFDTAGKRTGRSRHRRVSGLTARKVWREFYGRDWPEGAWVCHHCDEPRCANPEHFFPGDAFLNMQDAFAKGRMAGSIHGPGEEHHFAKMDEEDVYAIRLLVGEGWTQKQVAEQYGLNQSQVSRIVNYKRWGGDRSAVVSP